MEKEYVSPSIPTLQFLPNVCEHACKLGLNRGGDIFVSNLDVDVIFIDVVIFIVAQHLYSAIKTGKYGAKFRKNP